MLQECLQILFCSDFETKCQYKTSGKYFVGCQKNTLSIRSWVGKFGVNKIENTRILLEYWHLLKMFTIQERDKSCQNCVNDKIATDW